MQHKIIGNKGECVHALAFLQNRVDGEIKEKSVFPRMTEVVLERTFDINKAQKILDDEGLNVGLFDSGYAFHINSRGIDKGTGFLEALKMLQCDVKDANALRESETDVPHINLIPNNKTVNNSINDLKKVARIVTTKESGEGVLEGLDMISSQL